MFQPVDAQDKAKESRKQLRSKMRTSTVFAMSLAGCFLVCGTGYGSAVRSDGLNTKSSGFSFSASENLLDDDEDDYRVKELKDHNAKQAQKIRLLRQELAEKTQSVYEIKNQLFKQVGDPRDKEKISALNQALAAKEELMDELKLEIKDHERTAEKLQKQIIELEKSREQNSNTLKHQIKDLKQAAELNQSEFEKRGRVLETTQLHLSEALENKTTQIAALEHELSQQQLAYIAKSEELKNSTENFSARDAENKRQILELMANLETENRAKVATRAKLKKAIEEKNTLVGSLQQELENYKLQYELASADFSAHKENSEASTNRALESLHDEHRQVKDELSVQVAKLTEALDEAKETSSQFQQWLYAEIQMHSDQKNRADELVQALEDKQRRSAALELSLNSLVADVNRLEIALKAMQDSTENDTLVLDEAQKNSTTLQKKLDEQGREKKLLSEALLEKEDRLAALEETLKNIVVDIELLENALVASQELVANKSTEIARLEDNSSHLQKKLEEEIDQKTKLTELLGTEKQNVLAISAQYSEAKKQFELQLQEGLGTHKALTAALMEQQRRAEGLDEDLIVKSGEIDLLKDDLAKAQGVIAENAVALTESKKVEHDLNEAQGIIFDSYLALIESQEGAQALQSKIEEEIAQRKAAELVLRDREAQEFVFNEAIISLRQDAAKHEKAVLASQKAMEENAIALNVASERVKMLELRLEDKKGQRLILSEALQDKQEHTEALDKSLKAQVVDMDTLKNALAIAQEKIEKQAFAMDQAEKALVESHTIILNNYDAMVESEKSVLALQAKIESEKASRLSAEKRVLEKEAQTANLAAAIQVLSLDAERYENALTEAQKYIVGNSSAVNEVKEYATALEKRLNDEKVKHLVLIEALEEKQKHVSALEETLNSQIVDAERLHGALSDAKGIIQNHVVVLEGSKKIEVELEKAQIALAKHQDLLIEQQQVIDSYDKRESNVK